MAEFTNRLIQETSPYLLQHAHNPVDWYPWGDEALQRAKEEDKPILISIGYSACHWCHVMERESFENPATAEIMNQYFINIKIDREERPDIDHIYMDAVQAMTGSGGWPLHVFLTPEAKPFYGGTYFPPKRIHNRPSWQEMLLDIARSYKEKRQEIELQADNLKSHLVQSNLFGFQKNVNPDDTFSKEKVDEAFQNVLKVADKEWGGFGRAPKFPQIYTIQFLLRHYHVAGNKEALDQALLSLDKMIEGGIYDQVGGGFARYSTDTEWLVPHFEKMLYDNALLITTLCEAYQLTKKDRYKEVINETMDFIVREMYHEQGGFYAALDADSEGEEGKYYVWSFSEVQDILKEEADIFCRFYDISEQGNWEHKNILRIKQPLELFAKENNISHEKLKNSLGISIQKLLKKKAERMRPSLDDKIILSWNALMNSACSKAFMATGKTEYKLLAEKNMNFLLENLKNGNAGEMHHTWKNGIAKYPAFLEDYAFLIESLINLQEATSNSNWLLKAKDLTKLVLSNFMEHETGFFYFTKQGQTDVIVRKKEVYDGAVPSGNSIMCYNLYRLSILFDENNWRELCFRNLNQLGQAIYKYPTSFGVWACLLQELVYGTDEIAIVGCNNGVIVSDFHQIYIPHRVLMISDIDNQDFPLLAGKHATSEPLIYVCKEYACRQPVGSIDAFMLLINRQKNDN